MANREMQKSNSNTMDQIVGAVCHPDGGIVDGCILTCIKVLQARCSRIPLHDRLLQSNSRASVAYSRSPSDIGDSRCSIPPNSTTDPASRNTTCDAGDVDMSLRTNPKWWL